MSNDTVGANPTFLTKYKGEHMYKFMILMFIVYSYISFFDKWNAFILAHM